MSDESDCIDAAEFAAVLPDDWKPFIEVLAVPMPKAFGLLLVAWKCAIATMSGKVEVDRNLVVVLAKAPFQINLDNGTLTYTPNSEDVINVHVGGLLILLDCEKMMQHGFQLQVACILEEFVHALMHVSDEELVSEIVALLYDGVEWKDGKYHAVA